MPSSILYKIKAAKTVVSIPEEFTHYGWMMEVE